MTDAEAKDMVLALAAPRVGEVYRDVLMPSTVDFLYRVIAIRPDLYELRRLLKPELYLIRPEIWQALLDEGRLQYHAHQDVGGDA